MKSLFFNNPTWKDENEIPPDIIRSPGLHIRCTTKILSHIPIEGVILHIHEDINPIYFISLLACSWLKKIKYLRIWQNDKQICVIYSDKINIEVNCFTYITREEFIVRYHNKLSDDDRLIFTEPPIEVKNFFSVGIRPDRLIIATPGYLRNISTWNTLCYRNCVINSLWLLYFICCNSRRKIRDDGILMYKWNKKWYTMTKILQYIYHEINIGMNIRYVTSTELKYIDEMYLDCLSIEILALGRDCKAHP